MTNELQYKMRIYSDLVSAIIQLFDDAKVIIMIESYNGSYQILRIHSEFDRLPHRSLLFFLVVNVKKQR